MTDAPDRDPPVEPATDPIRADPIRTDNGLRLIADELARALDRANAPPPPPAPPDRSAEAALRAENAALRRDLFRLRAEHDALSHATTTTAVPPPPPPPARPPRRVATLARRLWSLGHRTATLRSHLRKRRAVRRDLAMLAASPLFDRAWYSRRHAVLLPPGTDPVAHYYWIGARQNLDPHPLFDTAWYRSRLPDAPHINPLAHYLRHRGRNTPDPHPLFDTAFHLAGHTVPDHLTPLEHYLSRAATAAVPPNPVFEPTLYAVQYLGGAHRAPEALAHYLAGGEAAGHWPHPLFDPAWYRNAHPDAEALGPLAHYLRSGARAEGLPCSEPMLRLGRPLPLPLPDPDPDPPRISIVLPPHPDAHECWRRRAVLQLSSQRTDCELILSDDRDDAVRRARGRDLVLLHPDAIPARNWLSPMLALLDADPRIGMVGPKLLHADGSLCAAGGILRGTGDAEPVGSGDDPARGCHDYVRDVDLLPDACVLLRRSSFHRFGGGDGGSTVELATALRDAGHRIVYQPASEFRLRGSDPGFPPAPPGFERRWATLLARQPAPGDPGFPSREPPSPRGVILVIDDAVPDHLEPSGTLALLRELGARVVFAPHDGDPRRPGTRDLQQRGIEVLHRPDSLPAWLPRHGRFLDQVWIGGSTAAAAALLPVLKRHTGARILFHARDPRHFPAPARPPDPALLSAVDLVLTPDAGAARTLAVLAPDSTVSVLPSHSPNDPDAPPAAHARRRLFRLLGPAPCPVCGAQPRPTTRAHQPPDGDPGRPAEPRCLVCDASNRDAVLADAILLPWRHHGAVALVQAGPYLLDRRVHLLGPPGPVGARLRTRSRFTQAPDLPAPAPDDDSLDLLLVPDPLPHHPDPERNPAAIAVRALKPGGRALFAAATDPDLSARLAVLGFTLRRHELDPPDAAPPLPVLEALRPG